MTAIFLILSVIFSWH